MTMRTCFVVAATAFTAAAISAPLPLEHFARRPQMYGVTISADGRFIAFLSGAEDDTVVMIADRTTGGQYKRVTASEPDKFDIGWCRWANEKRLLCSLYGNIRGKRYAEPPFKRLVAIDADGSALKVLEKPRNDANPLGGTTSIRNLNMNYGPNVNTQGVSAGPSQAGLNNQVTTISMTLTGNFGAFSPERQDDVIDLTPDDRDTVLIQADDDRNTFPSISRLDIYTGQRIQLMSDKPPISTFVSDGRGSPRLGWGVARSQETSYFVRPEGQGDWWKLEWQPLSVPQPAGAGPLRPIALGPDNSAYAFGTLEGRNALWSIDLAGTRPPKLLFKHPLVDLGEPILQRDRQLLGVRYEAERPSVWYTDPKLREIVDRLERRTVSQVFEIMDSTAGLNALVVRASSPVDEGTWYTYDFSTNKLQRLGTSYPELDQQALGTISNISYKASDGTQIPGYLTVPSGAAKKNLPLVVMPHDGPVARDTWKFSYLRTFLANRGYAVLQMNYRGSSGYGEKWLPDPQQDWGALIQSDIQDATRWAVAEGIADPKRICILGWGFGGYEALLSAARSSDTYRCAVSIGGMVDLGLQQQHAESLGISDVRQDIGSDREKLQRDSPLEHAAQIAIPVLLVHGTKDWQVQMDHAKAMEDELRKNKKPVTAVFIKGAGHDLERKSDRMTLLQSIEEFLAKNL